MDQVRCLKDKTRKQDYNIRNNINTYYIQNKMTEKTKERTFEPYKPLHLHHSCTLIWSSVQMVHIFQMPNYRKVSLLWHKYDQIHVNTCLFLTISRKAELWNLHLKLIYCTDFQMCQGYFKFYSWCKIWMFQSVEKLVCIKVEFFFLSRQQHFCLSVWGYIIVTWDRDFPQLTMTIDIKFKHERKAGRMKIKLMRKIHIYMNIVLWNLFSSS